ncbi:hypothetical protein GCM10010124_13170 [Pilimelia terevasa]|uniref:Uncharacterized protein n=1 Tax=Pilimelia terevasa TaxID=53372 RepID=A0A8J3BNJ2_9ACTN|nr:hypothetical protein [Pilimelia terevasa]GGK22053.1 hypothetical protein GCM10010124_13170 [Pilimelia terevasa]
MGADPVAGNVRRPLWSTVTTTAITGGVGLSIAAWSLWSGSPWAAPATWTVAAFVAGFATSGST